MQFTGFIRKVFAAKILLSGKFLPFLTLGKGWLQELLAELEMLWEGVKKSVFLGMIPKLVTSLTLSSPLYI